MASKITSQAFAALGIYGFQFCSEHVPGLYEIADSLAWSKMSHIAAFISQLTRLCRQGIVGQPCAK